METEQEKKDRVLKTLQHILQVLNMTITNDGMDNDRRPIRYQAADAAFDLVELIDEVKAVEV